MQEHMQEEKILEGNFRMYNLGGGLSYFSHFFLLQSLKPSAKVSSYFSFLVSSRLFLGGDFLFPVGSFYLAWYLSLRCLYLFSEVVVIVLALAFFTFEVCSSLFFVPRASSFFDI